MCFSKPSGHSDTHWGGWWLSYFWRRNKSQASKEYTDSKNGCRQWGQRIKVQTSKARENRSCCENGVAQALSLRWKAKKIMKGTRCDAKKLALHLEGSEERLEGWNGHAQTCRGFQKVTLQAVQRINRGATEKATQWEAAVAGRKGRHTIRSSRAPSRSPESGVPYRWEVPGMLWDIRSIPSLGKKALPDTPPTPNQGRCWPGKHWVPPTSPAGSTHHILSQLSVSPARHRV